MLPTSHCYIYRFFTGNNLQLAYPLPHYLQTYPCQNFQVTQPLYYILTTSYHTNWTWCIRALVESSRMIHHWPIGITYAYRPLPQEFDHVGQGNQIPVWYLFVAYLIVISHIYYSYSLYSTFIPLLYHDHRDDQTEKWNQYRDEDP